MLVADCRLLEDALAVVAKFQEHHAAAAAVVEKFQGTGYPVADRRLLELQADCRLLELHADCRLLEADCRLLEVAAAVVEAFQENHLAGPPSGFSWQLAPPASASAL